jgi:ribose transport system ATP-binding protein
MTDAPAESELLLRASGVCKAFSGVQALTDARLDIGHGELHALAGANGSGKSTFVKVLAGVEHADAGELLFRGGQLAAADMTPPAARALGFRFVHQDPGVFPELSVAENLAIGRGYPTGLAGRIRWRQLRARSLEDLDKASLSIAPDAVLGELSAATRTLVAIARALQDVDLESGGVLVLDEPTSALPAKEAAELLDALQGFTARGLGVLLITHRLSEIVGVADRITVFRDGRTVADVDGKQISHAGLVELMIGRAVKETFATFAERAPDTSKPPVLQVSGLGTGPLADVSLSVAAGEVVGIAGLLGSGRSTLLRTIFGEIAPRAGRIALEGTSLAMKDPATAMRLGIGYIPQDRGDEAAFLDQSVMANLLAASTRHFWRGTHMSARLERTEARRLIGEFGIKTRSESELLFTLSGGNQQKVMIARWMRRQPRLLLLDEPTQGVDVGARADIYEMIRAAVERGAAVLLVVSEFDELASVADRVLVLRDGRIATEVTGPNIDADRLTDFAYGEESGGHADEH